ncbi:hypothetical protein KEM56_006634 [Ascosphaera pollenicola]|nr:hypothetical protein KEM56_006634 [Ascosphaera pollenicola]
MTTQQRRGPWLQEEDQQLLSLVNAQGASNWVRISESMKYRTPKQCRERFHQNLKPTLNHDPITPEEGAMIEQMVREMGRRWAEIARRLGNRSDNSVKNWWNGSVNRRRRVHTVGSGSRASTPRSDVGSSYDARYARYSPVGVPYSPPVTEKHIHSGSSSPAYPEYSWPSSSSASTDLWRKQQHRQSYESAYSYRAEPQLPSPVFTEKSSTPASQKPPSLFSSSSSAHSESPVNQSPDMPPIMMMTPSKDESTRIVLPGIDSLTNFDGPRSYAPTTSYERTTLQCRREPSAESVSRPASRSKDSRMSISNLVAN